MSLDECNKKNHFLKKKGGGGRGREGLIAPKKFESIPSGCLLRSIILILRPINLFI